jgi:hypothetical protein
MTGATEVRKRRHVIIGAVSVPVLLGCIAAASVLMYTPRSEISFDQPGALYQIHASEAGTYETPGPSGASPYGCMWLRLTAPLFG